MLEQLNSDSKITNKYVKEEIIWLAVLIVAWKTQIDQLILTEQKQLSELNKNINAFLSVCMPGVQTVSSNISCVHFM